MNPIVKGWSNEAQLPAAQQSTALIVPPEKLIFDVNGYKEENEEFVQKIKKLATPVLSSFSLLQDFSFTLPNKKIFDDLQQSLDIQKLFLKTEQPLINKVDLLPPPPINFGPPPSFDPIVLKDINWGKITKSIIVIPEDSLWRKLLSCIPVFGIIPAVMNERSLKHKIKESKDNALTAKLIRVQNHYKYASIARGLTTLALIISGISLGILSGGVLIAGAAVSTAIVSASLAFYGHGLYKNRQLLKTVE